MKESLQNNDFVIVLKMLYKDLHFLLITKIK